MHVQKFWKDLLKLLQDKCVHCARLLFTEQLILFGSSDNIFTDNPIDFMILFAKFYIYKCRFQNITPKIRQFLSQLQNKTTVEKLITFENNKHMDFERSWQLYAPLLECF